MTKLYRNSAVISVVLLVIVLAWSMPYLRRDDPSIDQATTKVLLMQARTDFDAPLLEIITRPSYRLVEYSGTTGKVAVISWFGIRIATMTMQDCKPLSGVCNGDHIDYGLGW